MVAIAGIEQGSTIRNNTPKSLHPSIFADSSKPTGRFIKKLLRMIILNAFIETGITRANNVFIRPVCCTTKKVGIIPPLKSIVKIMKNIINLLPTRSLLDNPYAVKTDRNMLHAVPPTVTPIETNSDLRIVSVEKIYLYASKLNVVGKIKKLLCAISALVANELPITCTKGSTHKSAMTPRMKAFMPVNNRFDIDFSPTMVYLLSNKRPLHRTF